MIEPRVFLDTSALFSGIWSETGATRQILRLGEADVVSVFVGERVVSEIEAVLRDKAPDALGELAVLMDSVGIVVVGTPPERTIRELNRHLQYRPDAEILASAVNSTCEWFLTYNRADFLSNEPLNQEVEIRIGTGGDFLDHLREKLEGEGPTGL